MAVGEDLLRSVFLRLPWKALFRFKAVCKFWDSIITDPAFLTGYRNFPGRSSSPQYAGYFLYPTRDFYPDSGVPIHFFGNGIVSEEELTSAIDACNTPHPQAERSVICSSNGILLCYGWESIQRSQRYKCQKWKLRRYYVCNPLTNEWRSLPFAPVHNEDAVVGFVCRESEPDAAGSCYEYEVVQVLLYKDEMRVQIYHSWTDKWSKTGQRWRFSFDSRRYSSVFVRGRFYWADVHGNLITYSYRYGWPNPRVVQVPPDIMGRNGRDVGFSIGESTKGELVAYVTDKDQFNVWVYCDADDNGRVPNWQNEHHVKFSDWTEPQVNFLTKPYLRQMPGDPGKILLGFPGQMVYSYDLTTGKLEKLPDGQESCLAKMYDYYYCPYHLPSWYFRLGN